MSGAMPEESQPAKNKPAKKKAQPASPPAPKPPEQGFQATRTWAVLGVLLVGGVIAWKLLGTSYKHDVETICNAEKGSGLSVEHDASKVTLWVRDHLGTPEGNQLYSALTDTRVSERSKKLQDAADQAHVAPCPIIASYQQIAARGDQRSDVQHLCSDITFPKLANSDDATRLAMIEQWIDTSAKSPLTKDLGAALQKAPTGAERAKVLSDAATGFDVFTCTNAKTLETPPTSLPNGAPLVRLYSDAQIIGGATDADVKKALADLNPALLACYQEGLGRKSDLTGRLVVKVEVDATGKVVKSKQAEGTPFPDTQTVACVVAKLQTMKLPVTGPLVSLLLPFELTRGAN
jgi:hypothetical protein